jgi:hypothetical protein
MKDFVSQLPTGSDLRAVVGFMTRLPALLRRPVTAYEARLFFQQQLARRDDNLLTLIRDGIYAHPESPYRRLLANAGCAYQDVEQLVRRNGIENALQQLFHQGVYLSVDEFKGRRPVIRGNTQFEISPGQLRNPSVRADLVRQTSGSRGAASMVPIQFDSLRSHAIDLLVDLELRGGIRWVHASWSVPGAGSFNRLVSYSLSNLPVDRSFFLVQAADGKLHPRYLWSNRFLRYAARCAGIRLPRPRYVPMADPLPIVRWMSDVLRTGRIPHLHAYASCVARICRTALDAGTSLEGAQFAMGGEPTTAARLALVHAVGARADIHYSTSESGGLGRSCMAAQFVDEVHFRENRCAMIQPGEHAAPGLPPSALLVTSILPDARMVLLNVSTGDQAVASARQCGCPLENAGLKTRLHTIRSFEKLTAGGATFLDTDLIRVLEEVMPSRFGGGPTDYQLVDEETENGAPRVLLMVHPRLGPLDAGGIRQVFLEVIGQGSGVERVMMSVWRDAGLPIVEREAAKITAGGKILHVHRSTQSARVTRRDTRTASIQ